MSVASQEPRWVDLAISRLLRGGVLISIAIVLSGVIFTFVHHHDYLTSRAALRHLTDADQPFPSRLSDVLRSSEQARGQALAMLGLLLLIATPVARVALSIVIFVIERDPLYVAITALVLILLVTSFIVGASA